jgi:uncharacterized repeat protein (TIGR03803 family)
VPALITLGSFDATDGANPTTGLVMDSKGDLFGNAPSGGLSGVGTIFEVASGSRSITDLANFDGVTNGDDPIGDMIMDSSGNLYGTGSGFLLQDPGNVYEYHASTRQLLTLATFNGTTDGTTPLGGVVMDQSGNLYGTTSGVDPFTLMPTSDGTIFELQPGTGAVTTLASFNGTNGANPVSDLLIDSKGNLFGTTAGGGTGYTSPGTGYGTIFELPQGSHTITRLASFSLPTGVAPNAGLVRDSSGNFYGTCVNGGANNYGTVYELPQGSSTPTAIASFDGTTNGNYPAAALLLDSSGNLYGTTSGINPVSGSAVNNGTVFEIKKGSNALTTLLTFPGAPDGANPYCTLIMDGSGNLYGTTVNGGARSYGTVFELTSPLVLIPSSLPNSDVGVSYTQTLTASGGTSPYTFTVTSGTLPTGLTLSSGGALSGTATTAGTYNFTVQATDSAGDKGSRGYAITINPAVTTIATKASPTTETVGSAPLMDSATLSGALNPTGSITFTLIDPTSTVVDTETVAVSGNGTYSTPTGVVPTTSGTYNWVATYSGDSNNAGVTSSREPVSVLPLPNLDVPAGTTLALTGNTKYNLVTIEGSLTDNGSLTASSVSLDGPGAVLGGSGSVLAPVAVTGAGSGSSISGSFSISNQGGTAIDVQAGANNVTITGIIVTGSGVGILLEPSSGNMASVTGSTITTNAEGVEVLNGCDTVTSNMIGGSSGAGNNDGVYIPASGNPLLTLEGNNISYNSVIGLNNQSSMGVTAILNWWGNAGGPGPVDGAGRNPIVGVPEDDWAPYALDTTSVGPNPTTFDFFNGTGANGNVYVTGTLGTDNIVATVDATNKNLIHVTGSASPGDFLRGGATNRVIIYSFGSAVAGGKDSITVSGDTATAPWNAQINSELLTYRDPTFSGISSTNITVTGFGSDVIFGGGNDNVSDKTTGNDVIVSGLCMGQTGAPSAPQMTGGTGSNIFIAGYVDCTLAPTATDGRLDYETLSAMDALWASSGGGVTGAMNAPALFSVANMPQAIQTGPARAVIIPATTGGKNWYIVRGANNPTNTPTGANGDYIAGSTNSPNYRQTIM